MEGVRRARLTVRPVPVVASVAAASDPVRRAAGRTSSTLIRKRAAHLATRTVNAISPKARIARASHRVVQRPRCTHERRSRLVMAYLARQTMGAVAVVACVARAADVICYARTVPGESSIQMAGLARHALRTTCKQTADVKKGPTNGSNIA